MKTVLAELHELINDLEDQGLTAEASTLQEVFVRVAEEADMDGMDEPTDDDLANDVAALLKSHSASEVLSEIANQMSGNGAGDSNSETSSFAFGDEPGSDSRNHIVGKYSSMYLQSKGMANIEVLRQKAEAESGTPVRAEEIVRGPGYNSNKKMSDELGKDFSNMPYGRLSPTE